MPEILIPSDPQELLDSTFEDVAKERQNRRIKMVPIPGIDSKQEIELKLGLLIQEVLPMWAENPLKFLEHNGWAPDPLGRYADHRRLKGMAPPQAVPLILFDKQRELADLWWDAISSRSVVDIWGEKSRQQAATTEMIWLAFHAWLFLPACTGIFATYKDEYLDSGGKGQRDATSLFGRARLFLDYFLWGFGPCFGAEIPSRLKFNQHKAPHQPSRSAKAHWASAQKWRAWMKNKTGMEEAQDVTKKLVRPAWVVNRVNLFQEAEGNWIQGSIPGDAIGRSLSATYVLFDELAHYNKEVKADADRDSYSATAPNTRVRVGWGTPPKGGDARSLLYERIHVRPTKTGRIWRMHWIHNPVWMAGAAWICRRCQHHNPLPMHPPPAFPKDEMQCGGCQELIQVRTRGTEAPSGGDITSPRYVEMCERIGDKTGIAAELEIDWGGAQGDALFSPWDGNITARKMIPKRCMLVDGLDPGNSMKNTGAWFAALIDPQELRIQLVGYWMSIEPLAEFWLPFLKRWSPEALRRQKFVYGKHAGKRFVDVFHYPDEAFQMLDLLQNYHTGTLGKPLPLPVGETEGDKYGSHNNMSYSAYDVLSDYGVHVNWSYTKDREALVRAGVEWSARLEIHDSIADICPSAPSGELFPSPKQVFLTAMPREQSGQSAYKLDVDKKTPPHVHNAVDAYLYIVKRLMGEEIHANVTEDGWDGVDPYGVETELEYYGGDGTLG